MKIDQKGFGVVEGILILAVVALLGFVGYSAYKNYTADEPDTSAKVTKSSDSEKSGKDSKITDDENNRDIGGYRNEKYGFGFSNLQSNEEPSIKLIDYVKENTGTGTELIVEFDQVNVSFFSANVSYGSDWDGILYGSKPYTKQNGRFVLHPVDIEDKFRIEVMELKSATNNSLYVKNKCSLFECNSVSDMGIINLSSDGFYKSAFISVDQDAQNVDLNSFLKSFYQI